MAGAVVRRSCVDGGFAQVRSDVVTILTHRAVPAEQIDAAAAARELERVEAKRAVTDLEHAEQQRAVEHVPAADIEPATSSGVLQH